MGGRPLSFSRYHGRNGDINPFMNLRPAGAKLEHMTEKVAIDRPLRAML
jgi:hypothetical protein